MPVAQPTIIQDLLPLLVFLLAAVAVIVLALHFLRRYFKGRQYLDHRVFSVRLPKEKPEDEKSGNSVQASRRK